MLHILNTCTDPCCNLALEEYFLKHAPVAEDLLILWRNAPTVVIGRNQNILAEINQDFIAERNIRVVRRLSGGGAVYHDLGNLNFTFITALSKVGHNNFAHFTRSVIDALAAFGVDAEFTGRNDLTIAGQKFSGNAQYIHRDRLLHHGTLLFDTDLPTLAQALAGAEAKHSKPAVASVRSRVTTIRRHLPSDITLAEFEAALIQAAFARTGMPYQGYEPSVLDRQAIADLADRRYRDPNWTYGKLPPSNFNSKKTFAGGSVQVLLDVQKAAIVRCKIYGDFFATGNMDELAALIHGAPYRREAISLILESWLGLHPLHNITPAELLSCFFPEA